MILNYFKIAFRNILNNKLFSFINVSGLSLGLTATILLMIFVFHEISYDRFHNEYDQIFRLTTRSTGENIDNHAISTSAAILPAIVDMSDIEACARIMDIRNPTKKMRKRIFL